MWLLFIQITSAIIAAIRGWGATPILIFIGVIVIGLFAGSVFGLDAIWFLSVTDWVTTIALVIMAIIGKKKPDEIPTSSNIDTSTSKRIKCPRCAELIMPDAKICRYCGYHLQDE